MNAPATCWKCARSPMPEPKRCGPALSGSLQRHGIPEAIRSDNGVPFASTTGVLGLSKLSAWWVVLGIHLERGRPGCPQDNGAHERFHWDVERELRGQEQQACFDEWRRTF